MIDARALGRLVAVTVLLVAGSFVVTTPAAAVARPVVTGLSAGAGPLGGGNTVSLTGSGFRSGVRVLFGSHAGTHVRVQSSHRLTVVAPAHAAGSVHVRVARGSATSAAHTVDRYVYAAAPTRITWKPLQKVDPYQGSLSDVSCPTTTFCLAVEGYGHYLTYDGAHWSPAAPMPLPGASRVSCPTATKCTAVSGKGYVSTWSGGSWSAPHLVDPDRGVTEISCPSTTFCMLVDFEGHYATGHDDTWTAATRQPDTFNAQSMDCTSSTFCLMVDGAGRTVSWDGATWHLEAATGDKFASALSCAAPTFCVTVEGYFQGRVFTWNGSAWSSQQLAGEPNLYDVDCATTTSCVAVGYQGQAWVLSGTTWTQHRDGARRWYAVSCASATSCVSVGDYQYAATWNGASWASPQVLLESSGGITGVSCSSSAFCVAVDFHGAEVTYLRGSWHAPHQLYPGGVLTAVSCPRSSFCLAVGSAGRTVTWNGSSWSAPLAHAGFGTFADVSCAGPTSCVAVSRDRALHWTGSGWRTTAIAPGSVFRKLDCPTTTYCLAVTVRGAAVTWNGHAWSAPHFAVRLPLSVACGAARECYIGSYAGVVVALHGSVWSRPYSLGGGNVVDMSCANAAFCAALATIPLDSMDTPGFTRIPVFRGAAVNAKVVKHRWEMTSVSCPASHFCVLADEISAVIGTR